MKLLILGVNGFIGHHLSKTALKTTDWEIYGMDMRSDRLVEEMNNPQINNLIEIAKKLEGQSRHASTHAAGVVVTIFSALE